MTVYAGDKAIYKPARGEPEPCEVQRHTAKRVAIVVRRRGAYSLRYVSASRLERAPGGGLVECR